uniref:Uncharacterized protein n=1 Tax=Arundo donax TaxID=35708 RepID=A0A0A9CNC6_ARUDO
MVSSSEGLDQAQLPWDWLLQRSSCLHRGYIPQRQRGSALLLCCYIRRCGSDCGQC